VAAFVSDTVRAVFFDAIGTLLFPQPSAIEVYGSVAARRGLQLSSGEIRSRFIAAYQTEETADKSANWITSEAREESRWQQIVGATLKGVADPDACFREHFDHFARPDAWSVNADAAFVLARLRERGLVLGIGSNYDSRLLSVLDGIPVLSPLRDRVAISAAIGLRKPARGFFREIVRRAGCEPGEVLFVGDDYGNDYQGAINAGLKAILLDPAKRHPEAKWRIDRLRDLLQ
jgi:putative hydrolase of the HAD superfamily